MRARGCCFGLVVDSLAVHCRMRVLVVRDSSVLLLLTSLATDYKLSHLESYNKEGDTGSEEKRPNRVKVMVNLCRSQFHSLHAYGQSGAHYGCLS